MKPTSLLLLTALFCVTTASAKPKQTQPSYNLQRGIEAYDNDDYTEAQRFFTAELEANPKNGEAYMWYACCWRRIDQLGNALNNINYALKYIPTKNGYYPWCLGFRSSIYLELGDTIAALNDLDKAIKINSKTNETNIDYLEQRANLYYTMGKYDLSDADYRVMQKVLPGYVGGHYGIGRNRYAQADYAAAKQIFSHVIRLSDDGEAYKCRAKAELKLEEYAEATSDIVKALELSKDRSIVDLMTDIDNEEANKMFVAKLKVQIAKDENTVMWLDFLAYYLYEHNRYEEAYTYYQQANTINKHERYMFQMAQCCYHLGNLTDALRYIDGALQEDSLYWDYRLQKHYILCGLNRNDEALAIIDKLIDEYPESSVFHAIRMQFNNEHRNYQAVLEDAEMAIAIDPDVPVLYNLRGRAEWALGDTAKARQSFERGLALDTVPNTESIAHYALFYIGKTDEARQWIDTIMKNNKCSAGDYYDAACIYTLLGDTTIALDYLQQALEKGYVDFAHIHADSDLDNIRELSRFKTLVAEYEQKLAERYPTKETTDDTADRVVEIPFTKVGQMTKVDCTINNLPLNFIFDTGAADVSLSQVEANFMFKNGYLSDKDVVGKQRYQTADGNISVGTVVNLRQINFGGLELTNVRASVVKSQNAPLLLGQSVLQRLGKIEIDNEKRVLKITTKN